MPQVEDVMPEWGMNFESADTINTINSARMAVNGGLTYAQSIGLSGGQGIGGYFTQLCNLSANMLKKMIRRRII